MRIFLFLVWFRGYAMSRFSVVIGSHQRSWYRVISGREYRLIMTVTHENYSRANERSVNDLALLLLNETVTYSKYVQPVCLPRDELSNHDVCYALGWGEMSNGTVSLFSHNCTDFLFLYIIRKLRW